MTHRNWLREPEHNFCAIVSGAIGFLGGVSGVPQEIAIQLSELYPCCPSTASRPSRRALKKVGMVGVMLASLGLNSAAHAIEFSYAEFDTVLLRHVRDGWVDYGALARDRAPLERFLAATRVAHPDGWTRDERLAFWVNVYNARVLDGVARRPGLKSVLDVGKTLGVPTLDFFHERSISGGRNLSLNDIEHEILRKGFHEPRVHFVLNCASASCPALPARALRASSVDSTLELGVRSFLLDRSKNRIEPAGELRLSSIFKWYRSDFESAAGSLSAFVRRHWRGEKDLQGDEPIRFLNYDWSLNGHW